MARPIIRRRRMDRPPSSRQPRFGPPLRARSVSHWPGRIVTREALGGKARRALTLRIGHQARFGCLAEVSHGREGWRARMGKRMVMTTRKEVIRALERLHETRARLASIRDRWIHPSVAC